MNTTRIPKNLPPFTPNSDDGYDVSPAGTVLLTAKWAYPQQGQAPETLFTQTKSKQIIQGIVNKAAANGCNDWQRRLSELASPSTRTRFIAATELVSHLTYAEFDAVLNKVKGATE